jgi:hypothetical protein
MAIHIECSNCGFQNELGRVFCSSCGQKLNLNDTAMTDLNARREVDFGKWIRFLVMGLLILSVGGLVGAILWPVKTPPVFFEAAGSVQIPIKAKAARTALSYNREIKIDLTEGELNGFLAERAKSRKVGKLAIDLKTGMFDLYTGFDWSPPKAITWLAKVKISVSMDMRAGFQAGVLIVERCRIGHLPLPGSSRNVVIEYFSSLFGDIIGEKRVVSSLKTVAIEESKVTLVLAP